MPADVMTDFSVIFQESQESGEAPLNWMLANTVSVFKEDPVKHRSDSLMSVSIKILEITERLLKNT